MRTPRVFLGFLALALILLLACGGSAEPSDEPASDRDVSEMTAEEHAELLDAEAFPAEQRASSDADREALVILYNTTGGPNWVASDNWLSDNPLHWWEGVFTDSNSEIGRVIGLGLHKNQLSGEIPPELGDLDRLKSLRLTSNQLGGKIPPELGRLASLQELHLSDNQLIGGIPPELGNLSDLQELQLGQNQLSGRIPPELGNLSNLTSLNLALNQLSGEIPPELGNLANLQMLALTFNQLSGEIPPELGNLANLISVSFYGNQLSGCTPGSLLDQMDPVEYKGLEECP